MKTSNDTPFSQALAFVLEKYTNQSISKYKRIKKSLSEEEKFAFNIILVLLPKQYISNLALTAIKPNLGQPKSNLFSRFTDEQLMVLFNQFPVMQTINSQLFQKILKKIAQNINNQQLELFIQTLKSQNLLYVSKSVMCIAIKQNPKYIHILLDNFKPKVQAQHILKTILSDLSPPKFDDDAIAKILLLFLSGTIKIDAIYFSTLVTYYSLMFSFMDIKSNHNFDDAGLAFIRHVYQTSPRIGQIVTDSLLSKLQTSTLTASESAILMHVLKYEELKPVIKSIIKFGTPAGALRNLSARVSEDKFYQNFFNASFTAVVCTMQISDKVKELFSDLTPAITEMAYPHFVISRVLNMPTKDTFLILKTLSEKDPTALATKLIVDLSISTKKAQLVPIRAHFAKYPNETLVGLYVLGNSKFITDGVLFKRVLKAVFKVIDLAKIDTSFRFPVRLATFIREKGLDQRLLNKFLVRVFVHKTELRLDAEAANNLVDSVRYVAPRPPIPAIPKPAEDDVKPLSDAKDKENDKDKEKEEPLRPSALARVWSLISWGARTPSAAVPKEEEKEKEEEEDAKEKEKEKEKEKPSTPVKPKPSPKRQSYSPRMTIASSDESLSAPSESFEEEDSSDTEPLGDLEDLDM